MFREGEVNSATSLIMPVKDGNTHAQELRAIDKLVPITSYGQNLLEDVLKGFQAGADDYITETLQHEELLGRCRQY